MNVRFIESWYFKTSRRAKTAESLVGFDINEKCDRTLGCIWETDQGKWTAEYFDPYLKESFDSRQEAASYLVAVSTKDADCIQFLTM